MRIVQLLAIMAAILFGVSKLIIYFDPSLADVAADGAASFGFSFGFILGSYVYLAPFIVAYIRQHLNQWWILALLLAGPFLGGFWVGFIGAGEVGMSFVNTVIVPLVWVGALVWSLLNNTVSTPKTDTHTY
jgi:hypothetical protein